MNSKRKCYRCERCNKNFHRADRLKKHSANAYKCDHCDEIFCSNENLQQHKRSIVKPVGEIADINQRIQGKTGYNSDCAIQAIFWGNYTKFLIGQKKE